MAKNAVLIRSHLRYFGLARAIHTKNMSLDCIITGIIFLFGLLLVSAFSGNSHAQDENITTLATKSDSIINEFKVMVSIINNSNENVSGTIELRVDNNSSKSNSTNEMSFPKDMTTEDVPLEFTSKQSLVGKSFTVELMYGDGKSKKVEGLIKKSVSMEQIKIFIVQPTDVTDSKSTVKVNITYEQPVNLTYDLQIRIDNTNYEKQTYDRPAIFPSKKTDMIPMEFDSKFVPPGTAYTVKIWINNEGPPLISQGKFDPTNNSENAKIIIK